MTTTTAELLHETRKLAAIYRAQYTDDYDPRHGYTKLLAATIKRHIAVYGADTAWRMYGIALGTVLRYDRQPRGEDQFLS